MTEKFRLGLFENPYVDTRKAAEIVGSKEHKAVAQQAHLESIILLTNDGVLPLPEAKIDAESGEARWLKIFLLDVDALSLYLNTDTAANPDRAIYVSADFRVLFAIDNNRFPTAVDRDAVLVKRGFRTMGMNSDRNVLPGYEVAVKTTAEGYVLELKLPFKALANERLSVLEPSVGMRVSFNLQFMDLDEATEDEVDSIGDRVSYITLFPGRPATKPGDWGFLEFK